MSVDPLRRLLTAGPTAPGAGESLRVTPMSLSGGRWVTGTRLETRPPRAGHDGMDHPSGRSYAIGPTAYPAKG